MRAENVKKTKSRVSETAKICSFWTSRILSITSFSNFFLVKALDSRKFCQKIMRGVKFRYFHTVISQYFSSDWFPHNTYQNFLLSAHLKIFPENNYLVLVINTQVFAKIPSNQPFYKKEQTVQLINFTKIS